MKVIMLIPLLCLQEVQYERGVVIPIQSRSVAMRPMQDAATTSQSLTREQWYEIRVATLEIEILQLKTKLAVERKAELIRDIAKILQVRPGWLYSEETGRFEKPKLQEK